jgi:mevalonate kinase
MGEYTVLDGSVAFALPTKMGQSMEVESRAGDTLFWKSYDSDGTLWLEAEIALSDIIQNRVEESPQPKDMLVKVLHEAHKANPQVLTNGGYDVTTKLTFPRLWGLGTSSTFITMVAQWFGINAYELLANTFGGSGYDIACAQHNTAVLYKKNGTNPIVKTFDFKPLFAHNLYFVYLNKKQNSREAIAAYRERVFDRPALVQQVDRLIEALVMAPDLTSFASALEKQEALLGGVLGVTPVQEKLFPDFKGVVKSLGGWGGDFVLATAEENPTEYFKAKGYDTVVPYAEMIL